MPIAQTTVRFRLLNLGLLLLFPAVSFAQNQELNSEAKPYSKQPQKKEKYQLMADIYADYLRALPDYQIQLGFGTLEQANKVMKDFRALADRDPFFFPNKELKLTFESPTYRVRLQYFADRIEAEKAFSELRKIFPSALILQPGSREIN